MDKIELKQLVERYVREQINTLIEYAYHRKDFISRVEFIIKPIITHYCLIRYAQTTNTHQEYINHWLSEIHGWMKSLMEMDLKDDNKPNKRYKAIIQALNNKDYLTNISKIEYCVIDKAVSENIDTDTKVFYDIMIQCQNDLELIANFIANKDLIGFNRFIKTF